VILVRLQALLKSYLMSAALLTMGVAFGILSIISHSVPVILMSVCLIGFGQGILFPLINVKVLGNIDLSLGGRVISIVSGMIYVGQFLSPVVLDSISRFFGIPTTRFQYSVLAAYLIISVGAMMLVNLVKSNTAAGKEIKSESL